MRRITRHSFHNILILARRMLKAESQNRKPRSSQAERAISDQLTAFRRTHELQATAG
jgi:hypothetical protein